MRNCTGTGSIPVPGTFDTLRPWRDADDHSGTECLRQPASPPISGCTACAWTNLTGYSATLSSGTVWKWSGDFTGIPAEQGPLFVSVRAANGTAYATMPNLVKMGLALRTRTARGEIGGGSSDRKPALRIPIIVGFFGGTFWQANAASAQSVSIR